MWCRFAVYPNIDKVKSPCDISGDFLLTKDVFYDKIVLEAYASSGFITE